MLDSTSTGLTAIFNGLVALCDGLLDLRVALALVVVLSLFWLACTEVEELDRLGIKPYVRRH